MRTVSDRLPASPRIRFMKVQSPGIAASLKLQGSVRPQLPTRRRASGDGHDEDDNDDVAIDDDDHDGDDDDDESNVRLNDADCGACGKTLN